MTEKPDLSPDLEEKLAELEILRQGLDESQKKATEYYDQLLRLRAEFDNYRKRMEKEKAESRLWGKQEVLLQLISLVDVFEQAMAQAQHAKDLKHVIKGLEMLHKSFAAFLKNEGIEPIETIGLPLDTNFAEVVEREEVDEKQAGNVVSEIQKGYKFQGKVLRASRVRVGVAKKPEEEKPEDKTHWI